MLPLWKTSRPSGSPSAGASSSQATTLPLSKLRRCVVCARPLSRSAFAKPSCVPSWSSWIPARLAARASSNCASAPGKTEASSLLSAWQSSAVRPW